MMNQNNGRANGRSHSVCSRCGSGYHQGIGRTPVGAQDLGGNRPRLPNEARGGCGCGDRQCRGCGGQSHACRQLLEQIRAVDFALWETILYLDVYPHSCDALDTYHKLKAQSEALRREYEDTCGPMVATGNQSTTSWDWMSQPFPWEYAAT